MREVVLLTCFAAAAGLIVYGLALVAEPLAWIGGGIAVAIIAWLALGEA